VADRRRDVITRRCSSQSAPSIVVSGESSAHCGRGAGTVTGFLRRLQLSAKALCRPAALVAGEGLRVLIPWVSREAHVAGSVNSRMLFGFTAMNSGAPLPLRRVKDSKPLPRFRRLPVEPEGALPPLASNVLLAVVGAHAGIRWVLAMNRRLALPAGCAARSSLPSSCGPIRRKAGIHFSAEGAGALPESRNVPGCR
jgi:hypothetical protein